MSDALSVAYIAGGLNILAITISKMLSQIEYKKMSHEISSIHILVNSNLEKVKYDLKVALERIVNLEHLLEKK